MCYEPDSLGVKSIEKVRIDVKMNRSRFHIQSLPYDPHSINLQILNFLLKFVIKFCIKWAPIAGKYHVDHIQKENSKNVDLSY